MHTLNSKYPESRDGILLFNRYSGNWYFSNFKTWRSGILLCINLQLNNERKLYNFILKLNIQLCWHRGYNNVNSMREINDLLFDRAVHYLQDLGNHVQFPQKTRLLTSRKTRKFYSKMLFAVDYVSNISTPHCEEGFTLVSLKIQLFTYLIFRDLLICCTS